jgi:hypothetical protein
MRQPLARVLRAPHKCRPLASVVGSPHGRRQWAQWASVVGAHISVGVGKRTWLASVVGGPHGRQPLAPVLRAPHTCRPLVSVVGARVGCWRLSFMRRSLLRSRYAHLEEGLDVVVGHRIVSRAVRVVAVALAKHELDDAEASGQLLLHPREVTSALRCGRVLPIPRLVRHVQVVQRALDVGVQDLVPVLLIAMAGGRARSGSLGWGVRGGKGAGRSTFIVTNLPDEILTVPNAIRKRDCLDREGAAKASTVAPLLTRGGVDSTSNVGVLGLIGFDARARGNAGGIVGGRRVSSDGQQQGETHGKRVLGRSWGGQPPTFRRASLNAGGSAVGFFLAGNIRCR